MSDTQFKRSQTKSNITNESAANRTGKKAMVITDNRHANNIQKKENKTGMPDNLKSGIENLSGIAMDNVNVHYNSAKPAQLSAHAYAQGIDIHIAPGQEKHLPHEAWHIVQQKQNRVKPTIQMKEGVKINDDKNLEKEADVMGVKAIQTFSSAFANNTQTSTPDSGRHFNSETQLKRNIKSTTSVSGVVQLNGTKAGIIGLTHLVRKKGKSIYEGDELPDGEVTGEDIIWIDTNVKLRSRRGPNQELYGELDKSGKHSYRWFKVLKVNLKDYSEDDVYVRDDAVNLSPMAKGTHKTQIHDDQRERVDTLEEAMSKFPPTKELIGVDKLSYAWDVANDPEKYGYQMAMTNFQTLWAVCGAANENLILTLNNLGAKPVAINQAVFLGAKGGQGLAALLKLPVTRTTIIQVADPKVHEFTLEITPHGKTYLHQGYLSNFNAVWWSGLVESDTPHFTMEGSAAKRMKEARDRYGNLQSINRNFIADGLAHFMSAENFGPQAKINWSLLPFPLESNLDTKKGQLKFTVTVFHFKDENAAHEALKEHNLNTPLIELVMKNANSVWKRIEATRGRNQINPSSGISSGGMGVRLNMLNLIKKSKPKEDDEERK